MRLLFVGDVVGESGRRVVLAHLLRLRAELGLDFVVVNAENAAGGFGVTEKIAQEFFAVGTDLLTMGNHVWDCKETLDFTAAAPAQLSARDAGQCGASCRNCPSVMSRPKGRARCAALWSISTRAVERRAPYAAS